MTDLEWLEPDALGGFASGTVGLVRTRRYHALLLSAASESGEPSLSRYALVNGVEVWLEIEGGPRVALSSQRYTPDVTYPDGATRVAAFTREPWPRWTFRVDVAGRRTIEIVHEVVSARGAPVVALSWQLRSPDPLRARLVVRPLISGRDLHATHHENSAFRFDAGGGGGLWSWRPYEHVPRILALTNGAYRHDPVWFRNFQYDEERARGLDFIEDLASPGEIACDLVSAGTGSAATSGASEALVLFAAASPEAQSIVGDGSAERVSGKLRARERARRAAFASPLHRSADDFLIRRGATQTIIAGYPWFTDWGRDTFIALRGLCIATGRLDDARRILLDWSTHVSEGMLPCYFPERGRAPEYNAVDASLWFIIALGDLLGASTSARRAIPAAERDTLLAAARAILDGYASGTRFDIHADDDGLLAAGVPGVQLTWMDAKVGDHVITPRVGKPVEVQALWLNALAIADALSLGTPRLTTLRERGNRSFAVRFWNDDRRCLFDVIDVDHIAGTVDSTFRPNQIFAVGGLPHALLDGDRARAIVDAVETRLLTPLGLRSLSPDEPGYRPHYVGGPVERDGAYHQGTVWPWLIASFADAWMRTRTDGERPTAASEARSRFLAPLTAHLEIAGLGHISEIADAEPPFTPRGCPFQAWSMGALLELTTGLAAGKISI